MTTDRTATPVSATGDAPRTDDAGLLDGSTRPPGRPITLLTHRPVSLYAASVLRIGYGLCYLVFLLRELPHRDEIWGPDSPWTPALANRLFDQTGWFSFLTLSDSMVYFNLCYAAALVVCALFLLGWRTRADVRAVRGRRGVVPRPGDLHDRRGRQPDPPDGPLPDRDRLRTSLVARRATDRAPGARTGRPGRWTLWRAPSDLVVPARPGPRVPGHRAAQLRHVRHRRPGLPPVRLRGPVQGAGRLVASGNRPALRRQPRPLPALAGPVRPGRQLPAVHRGGRLPDRTDPGRLPVRPVQPPEVRRSSSCSWACTSASRSSWGSRSSPPP